MPVRNGSFPEAPAGGHRSHVGALLDAVPVALPDEPPELVEEGAREALADIGSVSRNFGTGRAQSCFCLQQSLGRQSR